MTGILALALAAAAPSTASPDAEAALRCAVPSESPVYAREAGAVPAISRGQTVVRRDGQPAPSLMVEGWRPASGPLASVLGELGREAGFAVVGADGFGPVSWTRDRASLTQVLDGLTAQAGASWSYSSGVVRVVKGAAASTVSGSFPLPSNRDVTLSLLDTLRGYDASGVTLGGSGITFSSTPAAFSRIQSGISGISEVYAFDVAFLEGRPTAGRYDWTPVAAAGSSPATGRVLLNEEAASDFGRFAASAGDVRQGGSQTVAGPSGWGLVVPQSQCGTGTTELTLRPKRVGDGFSMQVAGFGATTDVPMVTLGQTLVLVAREPVGGWIRMITIRPRIVAVR